MQDETAASGGKGPNYTESQPGASPQATAALDAPPSHDATANVEPPPVRWPGIIMRLGPGMIIAGSIVGSGELVGTTKTGAEAGFWLLWLILVGCVIKVFVQVEFGRYSIVTGRSTMAGLNEVPGPRLHRRGNWLVWYWLIMWCAGIGQLGGIVGIVGQTLALSFPLTERGRQYNEFLDCRTMLTVKEAELRRLADASVVGGQIDGRYRDQVQASHDALAQQYSALEIEWRERLGSDEWERLEQKPPASNDDRLWAAVLAVGTSVLLMLGRYGFVQSVSTILVASFTAVTVLNVFLLQDNPVWAVSGREFLEGMSFHIPPAGGSGTAPLATAFATFGIIGVGAHELVAYPYWCLEKGYARFTGPRNDSTQWAERARGWMRVLRWDVFCSMVVYTFATMAFYLLGAAILFRTGLNPEKEELVRTLAVMYEPVFGTWAPPLFLVGAFAVLYSTFFVANASHARVFSDMLGVIGAASTTASAHRRRVIMLGGCFPILCLIMYVAFPRPARLILISGVMQALMLPMLAAAALFFRYRRGDQRIEPSRAWDVLLWISSIGMLLAGISAGVTELLRNLK